MGKNGVTAMLKETLKAIILLNSSLIIYFEKL